MSTRTLTDNEQKRIDATLRGFSSSQVEPHLQTLLNFVEGDPWVCNAVVKQTAAVTQLVGVLEGSVSGKCSALAASSALEVLGVLSMRTQSSRVAVPFCKPEGMRLLVRQLNFCDSATDVALATFLEQLFCGSESEPARAASASVGLLPKIVDRMAAAETPPMTISAFARVFVVAAPWHIARKQSEAHYAIDALFRIVDMHLNALVEERMSDEYLSIAEQQQQQQHLTQQHHTPHAAVVLTEGVAAPMADCYSHVLRCLVYLVSKHSDNSVTACSERHLNILAKLVSVVAKDTVPSRLIAMILWLIFSIVSSNPKLEDSLKSCLAMGFQWSGLPSQDNNNNQQQQQQQQSSSSSSSSVTSAAGGGGGSQSQPGSRPNSASMGSSTYIVGPNSWSLQLAPFRNLVANIPTLLETIRRDHLRPEVVAEALRELSNGAMQSAHGVSRSLARYVIGTPSIIKCLLLPVSCIDEDLVIRACQLLDFAVEGNPVASRSFLFLGGVLTLKDILDDYNPLVLFNGLMLAQHLAQDSWVMRELAERGVLARIMHMTIEELNFDLRSQHQQQSNPSSTSATSAASSSSSSSLNEQQISSPISNSLASVSAQYNEVQQSALMMGNSNETNSGGGTSSPSNLMSRDSLVATLLQTTLVVCKSNHLTQDVASVLSSQGKHFVALWRPIVAWLDLACKIISSLSASCAASASAAGSPSTPSSAGGSVSSPFGSSTSNMPSSVVLASTSFPSSSSTSSSSSSGAGSNSNASVTTTTTTTNTPTPQQIESLFPVVCDTASAVIRSILFRNATENELNRVSSLPTVAATISNLLRLIVKGPASTSNVTTQTPASSSSSSTAAQSSGLPPSRGGSASSAQSNQSAGSGSNKGGGDSSSSRFSLDGLHVVSCCYFLSSCCAVDPSPDGACQLQLISSSVGAIDTVSSFVSGGAGAGRVAAWTFLAAVSSRLPAAQQAVANNHTVLSVMETKIRDAGNFLDRATTIPRASGRPRSASSPVNQTMSLLQRVLECADHIFRAKGREYGIRFALDVGRILAHANTSMHVRSAALDVLQAIYLSLSSSSSSSTSTSMTGGNVSATTSSSQQQQQQQQQQQPPLAIREEPSIIPHLVQLLLLCEETEEVEATTMVANRAFKLLLSLPSQQTMPSLFKMTCDAMRMMNIKIDPVTIASSPPTSPLRNANNNPSSSQTTHQRGGSGGAGMFPITSYSSSSWPWLPVPAPQDPDDGHDLLVGLLPLLNGMLHHDPACCEALFPNPDVWSFFFVIAEAEEVQLGLRVLALLALGNMLAHCKNAQQVSVFFQTPNLRLQFLRATSKLLKMSSSLDELKEPAVAGIVSKRREANIISPFTSSSSSSSSPVQQQQQQQQQGHARKNSGSGLSGAGGGGGGFEQEDQKFLPDEALETIFFIVDRLTSFGRKLQSPNFLTPLAPSSSSSSCNSSSYSEAETQAATRDSSVVFDCLCCGCFSRNESVQHVARSLLYVVFQTEGVALQLVPQSRAQLRSVLSGIVAEMPPGASATDPRRQAQHILQEVPM